MKKIILNLIILIGISSLITGCLSAPYQQEYISAQLKPDLKKVNKNICINETSEKEIINVNKFQRFTKIDIDFETKKTNENVAKNYFLQYFKNVNGNEPCYLTVNTKINKLDTDFENVDGMSASFEVEIEVIKENKTLISNKFSEKYSGSVFMTFVGASAPYKTANESFHKGLLDVYETKVEKLLLKALEENK